MQNKFIPDTPGHYWYHPKKGEPFVIRVFFTDNRVPRTFVDGCGIRVEDLSGWVELIRIENIYPPSGIMIPEQ